MEHPTEAQAAFIADKRAAGDEPMDWLLGIKDVNSIWNVLTICDGSYCTGFWISVVCPVMPLYKAYVEKSKYSGSMMVLLVLAALFF